ncbi:MAG TPA: hypothetical protein DHW49_01450 [Anaerolineae bacterium]|nr:hypothetical protein [Anaerolineae bacterium]
MTDIIQLPDDKILWSEFHHYFTAFVVGDIKKSLQFDIQVGTIILTTIGLECLSGYYAGQETNRQHFVKFMKDFMPADYGYLGDDIYECVRNGLAHDYVIKQNNKNQRRFIFTGKQGEQHLFPHPKNQNVFYLNRVAYANDFLEAQNIYFEKTESNQYLWDKAMQRLHNQKGFLTVRPENEFIIPVDNVINNGTVLSQSEKSFPTGTSIKPSDNI